MYATADRSPKPMPTLYPSSSDRGRMPGRYPVRSRVIRLSQQLSQRAIIMAAFLAPSCLVAQSSPLDSGKGLQPHNVTVDRLSYQVRNAIRRRSLATADTTDDAQ